MAIVALHGGVWRQSSLLGATQTQGVALRLPSGGLLISPANSGGRPGPGQVHWAATLGAVLLTALAVRRRAGSEQCRP